SRKYWPTTMSMRRCARCRATRRIDKRTRPAGAGAAFAKTHRSRTGLASTPVAHTQTSPHHKPIRTAMMLITTLVVGTGAVVGATTTSLLAVGLGGGIGMLGVSETA